MMRKISLNYEDASGNITLDDGSIVGNWIGIVGHELTAKISVDDLIALRKADFTVDEIADLKRQKILG